MTTSLAVRPMIPEDVPLAVEYWRTVTTEDCERMGVDPAKLPQPEKLREGMLRGLREPPNPPRAFSLVWTVDGRAVGVTTLKNIVVGDAGDMHLHMWDRSMRGKGYGARLFCLAAIEFHERFQLKRVICEPKSTNPMPNAMLKKIGFVLEKTYVGSSSELTLPAELNRYLVSPAVAKAFLAHR